MYQFNLQKKFFDVPTVDAHANL